MRTLLATALAVGVTLPISAAVILKQPKPNEVSVTVAYSGKGAVDATHEIWVFLFDTPIIGQGVRPLAVRTITKSDTAATFKNVTHDTVYVAVAYDEKGDYDGNVAPPPSGAPVAYYTLEGKRVAAPIKTLGGARIKLSFGDSSRMQ